MLALISLFMTAPMQATYGPVLPPATPVATAPDALVLTDTETMLHAQGMSEAGIRALRSVKLPMVARGATRAAQCMVEKIAQSDPLSMTELAAAMQERDATAAAQAQESTRYLLAALAVLGGSDRLVFLKVMGTGGTAIGSAPPPRPEMARQGGGPGPGGPGQRPPGGPGGGAAGGAGPGGRGGPGGGRPPQGPEGARGMTGFGAPPPGASACERLLAG
jgi:hypothetical protein